MFIGICEGTRLAKRLSDGTLQVVTVINFYTALYDIRVTSENDTECDLQWYDILWRFDYLVIDDNIIEPIKSYHILDGHPSCEI